MAASSREKGVKGEAEVRAMLEDAGFTLRGLEGGGDWLAFLDGRAPLHVEVKRAERWKMGEWTAQLLRDAVPDAMPVLFLRRNYGPWFALTTASALIERLSR